MSFSIQLYQNNSEKNKIGKSLTSYKTMTGVLRNECSLMTPEILIESNSPILCNYAYISNFGRYYFITDVKCVRNNLYIIYLKCDVLETYKSQIGKNTAVIERSQYYWNLYMQDSMMPVTTQVLTSTVSFGKAFNQNGTNVLLYNAG